jgi:hypothetical protein
MLPRSRATPADHLPTDLIADCSSDGERGDRSRTAPITECETTARYGSRSSAQGSSFRGQVIKPTDGGKR